MADLTIFPRVNATCEVAEEWSGKTISRFCGEPTTHWYPAMGGGTMALCEEHAQKHLPHAIAISLTRVGE